MVNRQQQTSDKIKTATEGLPARGGGAKNDELDPWSRITKSDDRFV